MAFDTNQIIEVFRRLDDGSIKMKQLEESHKELRAGQVLISNQVAINTVITKTILDVVTTTRVLARVAKWLGAIAVAGSALWLAITPLIHGGNLPPK